MDLISRQAAIDALAENIEMINAVLDSLTLDYNTRRNQEQRRGQINEDIDTINELPSAEPERKTGKWIPVIEKLPPECEEVNITWVNRNPESYYAHIKGKPFTGAGIYCRGRWFWYSATCKDYCEEYGFSQVDEMDEDIQVLAWMPLPEPYMEDGK